MDRVEWAQQVAEERIGQQLAVADGLDAKGGILFAYAGAVIAAAGSFSRQGTEGAMLLAIGSALIALAATVFILWPQTFWDSPDAEKLTTILSQDHPRAKVVEVLLNRQLDDGAANEVVLDGKRFALRVAIIGAIVATALLLGEIVQGRGM